MPFLPFTVDAALLRELGERLVGRPHIALAELIKNAYDADATLVEVRFESDRIVVADNGHGMDFDAFKNFWMRVGSPHKELQRVSKGFRRPLTGSKGVGRLAAQFLAQRLELRTVAMEQADQELIATVDWTQAVEARELTKARAKYARVAKHDAFPGGGENGTTLVLTGLNQGWTLEAFRDLAREIWWLQPPFRSTRGGSEAFQVELTSAVAAAAESFYEQMTAALDLWQARLVGRLEDGAKQVRDPAGPRNVSIVLERPGGRRRSLEQEIANCHVDQVEFEIRVFKLQYRQPQGIKIGDLREYFNEFGGVHVYDAGFRLPYYGPENDWLGVEMDHSHRIARSKLLPADLQAPNGLTFLPTNSRLFGVVNIDTSREREAAKEWEHDRTECLQIQVSRDRLLDNAAYDDLIRIVRTSLDFFANDEARMVYERDALRPPDTLPEKATRIEDVLDQFEEEIPRHVYKELRQEVSEVVRASESEAEALARRAGLLGALATAGISALAWEHEAVKQYELLEDVADRLEAVAAQEDNLPAIATEIRKWVERARATRSMFVSLLDDETQEEPGRLKAAALVDQVTEQVELLIRDVEIDIDVDTQLRLPKGGFAEWSALFQNVFLNAANAMLDEKEKRIWVHSQTAGRNQAIFVEDVGVGIDLSDAEQLFEPFVRRIDISTERRALGIGGTGLGLTIVRMIANALGARVTFVEPSRGFATAFRVSWRES
jgi:signal transduction histidine kinase